MACCLRDCRNALFRSIPLVVQHIARQIDQLHLVATATFILLSANAGFAFVRGAGRSAPENKAVYYYYIDGFVFNAAFRDMRLINTETLETKEFLDPSQVKSTHGGHGYHDGYAILSHRWCEEEISYDEYAAIRMANHGRRLGDLPWLTNQMDVLQQRPGYQKILACCATAKSRGISWAWIDTCCIDKRSSSELSEAINSMWKWYELCRECYIYMADVGKPELSADGEVSYSSFKASQWWTRCWTLQELLAPNHRLFFSDDWTMLGTIQHGSMDVRDSFLSAISDASKVPVHYFINYHSYGLEVSVAQKMRWAAHRNATRPEDVAYSLLGLFEINMPLLYGEGERAFLRLQREIIAKSNDESIFVWKLGPETRGCISDHGILAPHPRAFMHTGNVKRSHNMARRPYRITHRGLEFDFNGTGRRTVYRHMAEGGVVSDSTYHKAELIPLLCRMQVKGRFEEEPCTLAIKLDYRYPRDPNDPSLDMYARYNAYRFGHELLPESQPYSGDSGPTRLYLLL